MGARIDAKLDSSPRRIGFEIFDVPVAIETAVEALAGALAPRLPAVTFAPTARRAARRYTVEIGPAEELVVRRGLRKPVTARSAEAAADRIVEDLQPTLAQRAPGLVFVHAGAVAWRGRALVLPGRSGCGKSELVAALVRAGAEYLSDEFAVFDEAGRVHPYARALALRRADGTRDWTSAAALGGRAIDRPVVPARIAFLRFAARAPWRPRQVSPGQAVLGLLRHTVAARRRLSLARDVLVPIASSVTAIRGARGEAAEVADRLLADLA